MEGHVQRSLPNSIPQFLDALWLGIAVMRHTWSYHSDFQPLPPFSGAGQGFPVLSNVTLLCAVQCGALARLSMPCSPALAASW